MIKTTTDLSSSIYKDALAIRKEVFIKEQKVPLNLEIDTYEPICTHFVYYNERNEAVGTIRTLLLDNDTIKFQRMAVTSTARKKGIGSILIKEAEWFAQTQSFKKITLGAQLTAKVFYENLGYSPVGDEFDDAGIVHITMEKEL